MTMQKLKIGSSGNGPASSQSTGMGAHTVAGNVRDGSESAWNAVMKTGAGGGAKTGVRAGFLGEANSDSVGSKPGYGQVSGGTVGGATGSGGKNGTAISSDAALPGMLTQKMGGAETLSPSGKEMKMGKGPGARSGLHKGFL